MPDPRSLLHQFWCRGCGIVWVSDEAPICRHNVIDPDTPPRRMVPLPAWHPFAKELA
jgi:hypothetical protein